MCAPCSELPSNKNTMIESIFERNFEIFGGFYWMKHVKRNILKITNIVADTFLGMTS